MIDESAGRGVVDVDVETELTPPARRRDIDGETHLLARLYSGAVITVAQVRED